MARFIKLEPVNDLPRRVRIDEFSNGFMAVVQYGSLDIQYLDKTGNKRYDYSRNGYHLYDSTGNGLFHTVAEIKEKIKSL